MPTSMRLASALLACSLAACGPSRRTLNAQPIDPVFVAATADATFVAAGKRKVVRFDENTGGTPAEVATFEADLAGIRVDSGFLVAWTSDGHALAIPLDGTEKKDRPGLQEVFGAGVLGTSLLVLSKSASDASGPIAGLLEIPLKAGDEGERSSPHREPTDFTIAGTSACWLDLGKRVKDAIGNVTGHAEAQVWCWSAATGRQQLTSTPGAFTAFHADETTVVWSDGTKVFRRARAESVEQEVAVSPPVQGATVAQVVVEGAATWVRWVRPDGKGDLVRVGKDGAQGVLTDEVIRGDVALQGGAAVVPFADRVEVVGW